MHFLVDSTANICYSVCINNAYEEHIMQNLKTTNPHLALKLIAAQLQVIAAQNEIAHSDFNVLNKLTVQLQNLLAND